MKKNTRVKILNPRISKIGKYLKTTTNGYIVEINGSTQLVYKIKKATLWERIFGYEK